MTPIVLPVAELKPALSGFSKIIHKSRSPLPVLQCLKIERTQDGWVCLTATDLDRFVTLRLEQPAKGEPVSLLVPFDTLQKVVKTCDKSQRVHLEADSNHELSIKFDLVGQLGETKTKAPPVEQFPEIPRIKGEPFAVPENLRLALIDAMACTSTDENRYVLTGVCVDTSNAQSHYVVGTDGRHLFSCNSFNLPLSKSLIIPAHKFLAWREFNLDGEWKMKVSDVTDTKPEVLVQFSSRRWRFLTKLIGGDYPNWQVCVPNPEDAKTHLQFHPESLQAVVQTLQQMPIHDPKHQTIGIQWKDRKVTLLAKKEPEDAWSPTTVRDAKGTGQEVTLYCDRRLLAKALDYGLRTIGIIDQRSPLRCFSSGRQMVIMPVRIEEATPPTRADKPHPTQEPIPKPERKLMTNPPPPPVPEPLVCIDQVVQIIGEARESIVNGLNRLQDASKQLRQLQKGRRDAERDLQTVRATLQSLTRLRI